MHLPSLAGTFGFLNLGGGEFLILILGIVSFFVVWRYFRRRTIGRNANESVVVPDTSGNDRFRGPPLAGRRNLRAIQIKSFNEERIEGSSQREYVDPGARLTVERSRTIEHAVTLELGGAVETGLKLDLLKVIETEIRLNIERRFGQSFTETETTTVSVELDGTKAQQWKLVWYDKIVTGVAECTDELGGVHLLSFRFPVVSELEAI